ncbi:g7580 [Coccomyxa viridis]|uniref:G7580 protein n=1 Tax=Coccomyxa viridis TaxID=1274662 RepID=A0ABP1FY67_9CHLO
MALSTLMADDDIFPGFNPFRSLMTGDAGGPGPLRPIPIDVIEKDDKFDIKADLPGVDRADVRLSADGDVLTIAVDARKEEEGDEEVAGYRVHRNERRHQFVTRCMRPSQSADVIKRRQQFVTRRVRLPESPDMIERRQQFVTRRVRLPESADMTKITAKMDNGTLIIDVPKNPDKVRQRQIDVS